MSANIDRRTLYLDNVTPQEIRTPKGGRSYLYIENHDAAKILYEEDSISTVNTMQEIQAVGTNFSTREWGIAGSDQQFGVPQGSIWLLGSVAGPQRVTVRQTARKE